ncbi:MAG: phenylalanine--tRNA ligase subunit alpha [Candidatus Nanohaloarchaea archaeon]|nr:phenylalanine--tRNA ligase subunit alpha [Candidatus Nanohaloarchaea archaeon]
MELHPKSKHLLRDVAEHGGEVRADELEDGRSHADIIRPAQWLEEAMLLEIEEGSRTTYDLTSTGEDAYINGLPEKRLLEELDQHGQQTMQDLQEKIGAFNIALGQCKQNGWIDIVKEGGYKQVAITHDGREKLEKGFSEEDILEEIEEDSTVSEKEAVSRLVERGLVEEKTETWQVLRLTEKGQQKIDEIKEAEEREEAVREEQIQHLTPDQIRSGEWKERGIRPYNVEADVEIERPGKKQPYRQYLDEVRRKFLSMGFREAKTPLVEMEFWNFDVLFQAQDHPAREIHDKFELSEPAHGDLMHDQIVERVKKMHEEGWEIDSSGWEYEWNKQQASRLMLRSQTTATTIRYLAEGLDSPAKVFAIDRNFRYDEIDQTHFVEFYQAEGIVKAEDLSLRDLFGYLKVFGEEIAGAEKIRFRPGYFPFTEPSVELDAYHPEMGWIELGGAGLFRPEVRAPLEVDDPVIAWGMGIDRLAMFKLGIDDIRELVFPQDIDYLRKSPAVTLR